MPILMIASCIDAAEKPDFGGTYIQKAGKDASRNAVAPSTSLSVLQTQSAIEIIRITDGKQEEKNTFPLDGTKGAYISPGGSKGACMGRIRGDTLTLDMYVTSRPFADGPEVTIHMRERWKLSSDSKTLTIRSEVDSPLLGGFQVVEPETSVYTRK